MSKEAVHADAHATEPSRPRLAFTKVVAALLLGVVLGAGTVTSLPRQVWPFGSAALTAGLAATSQVEGATPPRTASVGALGRLMPQGDRFTLGLPYGADGARVARWLASEGQAVAAGQVIAELDNLPQRLAAQATAAAQHRAKQAALEQVRSEVRLGWADAQAARLRADAAHRLADQGLARALALIDAGAIAQTQLEQARAAADQAIADQARARAALQRYAHAEGDADADAEGQPDLALALHNLRVAEAARTQARRDVEAARVASPRAGTLLALHVRAGERAGDQGLATLGDVDRMAAELEVYQTDIARVAVGQSVALSAAALQTLLTGTVVRVGMEVQRQAVLAADPVSHIDARVVKVVVDLDAASSRIARNLTGLQVAGRISVGAP